MLTHLFKKKITGASGGFTLIEVMVAVGIIAILSGVIAVSASSTNKQSRDAKRQSDLRELQAAVELYKNRHGRYPEACVPANAGLAQGWSGQQNTNYACAGGSNEYIIGLAPEFIKVLPYDKKLNGTNSGYVYRTNANGTVYKIKAMHTVEEDEIDYTHEFKACDVRVSSNPSGSLTNGSTNREIIGWCGRVYFSGNNLPSQCNITSDDWRRSYAVWGGFAPKRPGADNNNANTAVVQDTTDIICR
jgi:prepilin-type N-terminal cleavage/methylation domain-containing protein